MLEKCKHEWEILGHELGARFICGNARRDRQLWPYHFRGSGLEPEDAHPVGEEAYITDQLTQSVRQTLSRHSQDPPPARHVWR